MARVTLQKVSKLYPNNPKPAVNAIDLDIMDREFIVLVGPSGCGKSTTLRMVAGLEEISSGTISIGERIVNDIPPKDRDIAMVFQNYALYPHMTVYENMAFGLKLRKYPKEEIKQRVMEAAEILGIQEMLERKPKQLSGGQRQRVAVGRAIVRKPKVFLFDEPLSNLDAKLRVTTRAELKSLHQRLKTTTVYVTHDQEEAMTLGDRVVVMKDGLIQQSGSALEIYHLPANRFVAGFLGTPQMNFLRGCLADQGGQLVFDEGSGKLPVPGWARPALASSTGGEVVLGIRPEALSDRARDGAGEQRLHMQVGLVQPLGERLNVYLSTPRHDNLIAQLSGDSPVRAGDAIPIYFDMNRAHFFAPDDQGAALAQNRERGSAAGRAASIAGGAA